MADSVRGRLKNIAKKENINFNQYYYFFFRNGCYTEYQYPVIKIIFTNLFRYILAGEKFAGKKPYGKMVFHFGL